MVGGYLPRTFAAVLFLALSTLGISAQAITNDDNRRVCKNPVLAQALAAAADMKPVEAEIVSQSQRFHLVEPLLGLYLKYDSRIHVGRRLFSRLMTKRYAETVAQDVEVRSHNLVTEEAQSAFTESQIRNLSESLADVLRWRDRREAALHSQNAFLSHLDRALFKRLEKMARDTLRSENKRRHALREQDRFRRQLDNLRVRLISEIEEDLIGLPFLAKVTDFRDEFERVVLEGLFRHGGNADWALCTAGDSLRVVLSHGDHEPSADVLALHRSTQALYIIEIKRSPSGFAHAIEQLEETRAHLRRNGVTLPIHAAVAFPEDMEMHSPFREGRFGDLLRNNRPVYIGDETVQVMRF